MKITKSEQKQYIKELFYEYFETDECEIKMVPPSGSNRVYYILNNQEHTAVGVYGPDLKENRTTFYFTELFQKHVLPIPAVLKESSKKGFYLIEYLEGPSLLDMVLSEGHTDKIKDVYKKTIEYLVRFQIDILEDVDFSMCHAAEEFDEDQIMADLMYFKYYFLDLHGVDYNRVELFKELKDIAGRLSKVQPKTFMYRDFQGRNVLVNENEEPTFIDFQGGMKGLPQYDIASLLWQARAELPVDWKRELFNYYFEVISKSGKWLSLNEIEFRKTYFDCVLLRILQTLGAYGFRGKIEGKEHFLQSIYPALNQLKSFLDDGTTHNITPCLRGVLEQLCSSKIMSLYQPVGDTSLVNTDKLKIKIFSFSYKKGTAQDLSGNGGGFVFDCRGILNPGRQEAYKTLTGKDTEVVQYLEQQTQMPEFLNHVYAILDLHVSDFLSRGFEHLTISFGCTGGQHRSVYAAEHTAKYLSDKFGLEHIDLVHLEQEEHNLSRAIMGEKL